ncbi:hypothetical protein Tco_0954715 [Tanacetum coccineum]|uniref:Uncharacterized protein n=1 Tax=Tanacetum coccineum TaxID=301880 RepID=A0ABQ5E559_9ASTR
MLNQPLVRKRKILCPAPPKAPSLNRNLLEFLFNQRNQCSRLRIQTCHKIRQGIWVIMKMNQREYKLLLDMMTWFRKPTPPQEHTDPDWNVGKTTQKGPTQNWLMTLAASTSTDKSLKDFDELMSTLIDFSGYILNGLKIKNLTQEVLLGPAFRLLKGIRSSYAELEKLL